MVNALPMLAIKPGNVLGANRPERFVVAVDDVGVLQVRMQIGENFLNACLVLVWVVYE